MTARSDIRGLKNLGPKSERWLNAVGIHTRQDLERIGPEQAFVRVKAGGFKPNLNLLYALAGALANVRWDRLPKAERSRLILAADAAADALERVQKRAGRRK